MRSQSSNWDWAGRSSPAVIIQVDPANNASPHTIIAPFSTKIKSPQLPSHYLVKAGSAGLTHDSVLPAEQIRVIDKKRILRMLGRLSAEDLRGVEEAVQAILGIGSLDDILVNYR